MLETRAATVLRQRRAILDRVTVALEPGTFVAVCGPNGAGKSTLCSVLAGDLRCDDGEVLLDGRALRQCPAAELARHRAVMAQHAEGAMGFIARDVVAFGLDVAPERTPDEADDLVTSALAEVDAASYAYRPMAALSGGERQRIHLARALVQFDAPDHTTPGILLLDEPTASLDMRHQGIALAAARWRAEAGASVLAVLHDLSLAARFADRMILMAEGRIVADGPPADVMTPQGLEAVYGVPVDVFTRPDGSPFIDPIYTLTSSEKGTPCTSP